jgi:hypothetical protein
MDKTTKGFFWMLGLAAVCGIGGWILGYEKAEKEWMIARSKARYGGK